MLDPVALALVALYPLPNQPGLADGRNNYYYPDVRNQTIASHMVRMDHAFSQNHRMFIRLHDYVFNNAKDLMGIPATRETFQQHNRSVALDDVLVLSPTWVLDLRYGLINTNFPEARVTQGTDLSKLGFSPALVGLLDPALATIPRMIFGSSSGFTTLSDWSNGDGINTALTHNWVADFTKMKAAHSIRFGADFRLFRGFANRYPARIAPDFSFPNAYTRGPVDNSAAAPLGRELAAMLLGIPGGNMTSSTGFAGQNTYFGLYVQDDFKLSPKISVNLGLRYEMEYPLTDRYNALVAGYDFASASPVDAAGRAAFAKDPIPEIPAAQFAAKGGLTFVDANHRSPYNRNNGQFMPRAGIAYQVTSKTVLRAGYGIFFDTLGVDRYVPVQTGFSQQTPIQASLDNGQTYVATLANPLPNGLLTPRGAAGGLSTNLGQAISYTDPNTRQPYSQRWSFGVQQFLPGKFLIDASYVGTRNTHLAVTKNINSTPAQYLSTSPVRNQKTIDYLTATFGNRFYGLNTVYTTKMSRADLPRPYPQFVDITVIQDSGYSWYHALQLRGERRFSDGYTLQVGYTLSKYMEAIEFLNASDPLPYRSISSLDRPHVLTMSGVYEIPIGKGRQFGASMAKPLQAILGGWQLNGTVVRQSGQPLNFGNIIFTGDIHNIALPKDQHSADRWFNTDAGFERNSKNQLAQNIRTFPLRFTGVRGDGQSMWNFSLSKNFAVWERLKGQFRAENYNTMNHASFANPNTSPTNTAFGVITQASSEPRNWQFALKLLF